jgi:hypothetical protein
MIEEQWFEVSYAQFAKPLSFGRMDVGHLRIHVAPKLEAIKIKFMYPRNKSGNFGETTNMLPLYACLNHLFRKTMTPRKGDGSKIPTYNKNILVAMAPNANGFEFSVFDFIWEEIKAISENPFKSCGYAPYIMHMNEKVMGRTFGHDKDHHPIRIKKYLKAPIEESRTTTPSHSSSPPRAGRGRVQQGEKPPSPLRKMFSLIFGMCNSQHVADVKPQHERRPWKKDTKSIKEVCNTLTFRKI